MTLTDQDIVGQWALVSWRFEYDDGRISYPYGDDAKGMIAYHHGRMSCIISTRDRPNFATGFMLTAKEHERAAAYSTCFAYAGTYTVSDGVVRHQVDVSLYPDWDGTEQARSAQFDGELLHLTARTDVGTSEARTGLLTWRRLSASAPLD